MLILSVILFYSVFLHCRDFFLEGLMITPFFPSAMPDFNISPWNMAFWCSSIVTLKKPHTYMSLSQLQEMEYTFFNVLFWRRGFGLEEISLRCWNAFECCPDIVLTIGTPEVSNVPLISASMFRDGKIDAKNKNICHHLSNIYKFYSVMSYS